MNERTLSAKKPSAFIKDVVTFAVIGIIIAFLLAFILSILLLKINKYENYLPMVAVVIQCFSAVISGRLIGKKTKRSLLLVGVIEGIVLSLFFVLISAFMSITNFNFSSVFTSLPYIIASSVLGSATSINKK